VDDDEGESETATPAATAGITLNIVDINNDAREICDNNLFIRIMYIFINIYFTFFRFSRRVWGPASSTRENRNMFRSSYPLLRTFDVYRRTTSARIIAQASCIDQ
jgi:hypothetical protein